MRPEIIVPFSVEEKDRQTESPHSSGLLEIGTSVRITRDPYFGLIGTVAALPSELQELGSGSKARVLVVEFESAENVTVPRANVELIEE